jgi:hypothetical protein
MPRLPPLPEVERQQPRSQKKRDSDQMELLLPFAGKKAAPAKGDFVDPSIMAIG